MAKIPISTDAKFDNLEEFIRRFQIMKEKVEQAIEIKNEEVAEHIVGEIKGEVPVRSGTLQSTIRTQKSGKLKVRILAGGKKTVNPKTKYDYARGVEFGNLVTAAHPFFYNTVRRLKKYHNEQIQEAVKAAIKETNEGF